MLIFFGVTETGFSLFVVHCSSLVSPCRAPVCPFIGQEEAGTPGCI
jgi:hypothetical protein